VNIHPTTIEDDDALDRAFGELYTSSPGSFLRRCRNEHDWLERRRAAGIDSYQAYTTGISGTKVFRGHRLSKARIGTNFGSQDYLSLSAHPALVQQVVEVTAKYGLHSAGSAALAGLLDIGIELEKELAEFLGCRDATLFPIGWAAGYGLITSLVLPDDHIVIDQLAHACLMEGAKNATSNVHVFPHLSNAGAERRIKRIREKNPDTGILVVTETLFSMDSDTTDIAELQQICTKNGATLVVDCAHDLGAMGEGGKGLLAEQDMVGKVDVVLGAFSKSFASIGGFVACDEPGLKTRLRSACGPSTFTYSMTPIQIAIIRKALEVIRSEEGDARRARLAANTEHMRSRLTDADLEVLGDPSPIVPVILGNPAVGRIATKLANEAGAFVNLVEYPAVSKNRCRWRIQMQADHTFEQIDEFVAKATESHQRAIAELSRNN
jgi:7-keto-8-aminopelargonate synthetase-like enzyme